MTPELVLAPIAPVVTLEDLRLHLRVDLVFEDALIEGLEKAAVGHLDGWRGVLGRAIMPQTWAQDFTDWGELPLLMPDVTSFNVVGADHDGGVVNADTSVLKNTYGGPVVVATGADIASVRVEYICSLPDEQLASAQVLVKMMVANWYENREANIVGKNVSRQPMAVDALITALRWRHV